MWKLSILGKIIFNTDLQETYYFWLIYFTAFLTIKFTFNVTTEHKRTLLFVNRY